MSFSKRPLNMAWEAFGQHNGAATYLVVEQRIRRLHSGERTVPEIGCRVWVQPFFLERKDWIPVPNWAQNTVKGQTCDTETTVDAWLWNEVQQCLRDKAILDLVAEPAAENGGPRYREQFLTRSCLEQGAFRVLASEAYGKRCASCRHRGCRCAGCMLRHTSASGSSACWHCRSPGGSPCPCPRLLDDHVACMATCVGGQSASLNFFMKAIPRSSFLLARGTACRSAKWFQRAFG